MSMTSKNPTLITIVVDNDPGHGLATEHGFAGWIETEGLRIMFDTGQGPAFALNTAALDIDLSSADLLVLSHGHFDHSGGLPLLIEQNPSLQVMLHPAGINERFSIHGGLARSIAMPAASRAALEALPEKRLRWLEGPVELAENVGLTGPIPRNTDFEDTGGPFFLDPEGREVDLIEDDLALWIRTEKGLVIVVGCSHAGLINTLHHTRAISGEDRIHAVIGGFHLLAASRSRLTRTIEALRALDVDQLIPCHCTGQNAVAALSRALNDRACPGASGLTLTFDL